MNRLLLRLYPSAWRRRYETEIGAVLLERPPSLRDRIDLIRGAVDAWLHPQVVAPTEAPEAIEPIFRPAGLVLAAVVSGTLFVASAAAFLGTPVNSTLGYKDSMLPAALLVLAMIVSGVCALGIATAIGRTRRLAGAILGFALVTMLPWPILIVGFLGYCVAAVGFGAWLVLVAERRVGAALVVAAVLLTSFNTEDERALFLLPIGAIWIALAAIIAASPARMTASA